MDGSQLLIAANRGPVSFAFDDDGQPVSRKGAGGLASALGPLVAGTGATWVAAAMTDADRVVARQGHVEADGFVYRALDVAPDQYRLAYDVVSNATLWFLFHHLYDLPRRPRIDGRWRTAWDGYRAYNRLFARALSEEAPDGGVVLIQDYHLCLVAPELRRLRPDLRTVHFLHTPFCEPSWLRVLPEEAGRELLEGISAAGACGFHSARWEAAFRQCCQEVLGAAPPTFVAPLAADPNDLRAAADSEQAAAEGEALAERVGDRRLIVRVDRMELSKNILRGFFAFDELLERRDDLRGRICFAALVYPSREGLADYLGYQTEVATLADQLNQRWATPGWEPVVLYSSDNFPRSVAALGRYDALLVNPVRDGLNLVAKEGPMVNRADGVVALSREAGVWDELGTAAVGLNPFDVTGTADALESILEMDADERRRRSQDLARLASARTPADWLADQLSAAGA